MGRDWKPVFGSIPMIPNSSTSSRNVGASKLSSITISFSCSANIFTQIRRPFTKMDIAPDDWLSQHAVFERAAAERRWKRKQANRVKERLDRLTIMQDADRQLERRLLNGGTPQGQAAFETGTPWFLSNDLSGNPDYILEYMSIPIERDLPSRIKDSIMDEKIYGDWEGKSMVASVV